MSEKEENIIYLDKTIFKAHSVNIKSWARKYENQVLNKEGLCIDTLAAAVIISGKFGLEQFIKRRNLLSYQTCNLQLKSSPFEVVVRIGLGKWLEIDVQQPLFIQVQLHRNGIFQGKERLYINFMST